VDGVNYSTEQIVTDAALCDRIRSGDANAEASLIERLQPGLRVVLYRATGGDRELAAELSQETLVVVLKRLRATGLNDPGGLAAFAAQTARNLAIAHRRKDGRRRTDTDLDALAAIPAPVRDHPEQAALSRLGAIVAQTLEQLPTERDRSVLKRFYLNEEDKEAICRDLQLSDLAFNQVLFRARGRFRSLLSAAGLEKRDLLDSGEA
jgi:RNA polymerase sigma-70 factor (ECF subfamily)